MKTTLAWLGALGLLAWTGAGLLAWTLVGRKIELRFAEPGADGANTELAERLESISTDLDALSDLLARNFELLAEELRADTSAATGRTARAEERLRALEQAVPHALEARETAGALSSVLARLERLSGAPPAQPPAGAPEEPQAGASAPTTTTAPAAESAAVEPSSDAPATKRSFLSFRLPSRDFTFAGRQQFEILEDLSRVGFDARSTLHDFSGVSDRVRGSFRVDLAHAEGGIDGRVWIASHTLGTGLAARDEEMSDRLGVSDFASIEFVPLAMETTAVDPTALRLAGRLSGRMTIRGVARDVTFEVDAQVDPSRRLEIEGESRLLLSDFGIDAPRQLGVISMEDEVTVWVHLRARVRMAEAER